jgi:(R,R)-butanediol dehydrogenase / meso-butanediol dehydrogenase / diacetyl reductase
VVIAEPNPNRATLAGAIDVGPVADPTAEGFSSLLDDLTDGLGVDVAIECSGSSAGLATCITSTRASRVHRPDGAADARFG